MSVRSVFTLLFLAMPGVAGADCPPDRTSCTDPTLGREVCTVNGPLIECRLESMSTAATAGGTLFANSVGGHDFFFGTDGHGFAYCCVFNAAHPKVQIHGTPYGDVVDLDDPTDPLGSAGSPPVSSVDAWLYAGGDSFVGSSAPVENTVDGGDGDDRLVGGPVKDRLNGGADDDVLVGLEQTDWLDGNGGDDDLDGGQGADRLVGDDGDDRLCGRDDNDALYGGIGDDVLVGGPGANTLDGGGGANDCDAPGITCAVDLSLGCPF